MNTDFDVIIYCGGKCGSSTLVNTLTFYNYKCIQVHDNETLNNVYTNLCDTLNIKSVKDLICGSKTSVYIIDSYRNPIERGHSGFFHNLNIFFKKIPTDVNLLIYWYNKYYLNYLNEQQPLDIEYPIFENVDFNFNEEYVIKIINNKTYIKLRFHSINKWSNILSKIFEKNIILLNENLSENKYYSELYDKFKKKYKVPIKYLKNIINDKLFLKYNNVYEQIQYLKYWYNKSNISDNIVLSNNYFINIPNNFNITKYKELNLDLIFDCDLDYKIHFEFNGFYENRFYE